MPKFAVVVCPHCQNAFIMEDGHRTVSCRSCNKRIEAARLKVFFASDDFREAQAARGSVVAGLAGDAAAFEEAAKRMGRDAVEHIGEEVRDRRFLEDRRLVKEKMEEEARMTKKKGQQTVLTEAFEELAGKGDVAIEDYWQKVSYHGIGRLKFDRWVDRMIESGTAYSPRHGYLRKS